MKIKPESKGKKRRFAGAALLSALLLILLLVGGLLVLPLLSDAPTAEASRQYGILGQLAPELNLTGWIDGNGKKTKPIRLGDHRGKVIYLYFFQDW